MNGASADIVMPRLSDTMQEGTILRWLKRDGEEVRRGEELVEIETDKATMSYESDRDGVLQTVASEGDTLAVGALIARVGDAAGTDAGPAADIAEDADDGDAPRVAPASAGASASTRSTPSNPLALDSDRGHERVKASPLARRMAIASGIELRTLAGSGPGGRIVAADVRSAEPAAGGGLPAAAGPPTPEQPASATDRAAPGVADVLSAKGETTILELSRTQQTIARRMAESKATIPDFTLQMDVDMQACVDLRTELKRLTGPAASRTVEPADRAGSDTAPAVPTYNDMVVKACALSLREHPRVNGSYRDGTVELHARVNVGVAVAAPDALLVPTVFDADEKSLGEIARETRRLAERARDATITPPELSGGTFSVSNLGMYGVQAFSAIVNPPQAAILAVGSVEPRALVREGEVRARHAMTLTLGCDHRMLYGADAAQFLARVRELLEAPAALTL
jgi:pyruvate dehydrogenase E2 component (dihydrolipoamide acetyltransferase)